MNDITENAKPASRTTGFYEQKGLVRYTVIFSPVHREKLKQTAKQFGITQGEVVEVMLDQLDANAMAPHFQAKKTGKAEGRITKTELVKKMKDLTPAQLAAIEAIVSQKK